MGVFNSVLLGLAGISLILLVVSILLQECKSRPNAEHVDFQDTFGNEEHVDFQDTFGNEEPDWNKH